jgi:Transposase IS66 family.
VKSVKQLDMEESQLAGLCERLEQKCLAPDDYEYLKVIIDTVRFLGRQHQQAATSMKRVLKMIFGSSTEKTDTVLNRDLKPDSIPCKEKKKRKGHGRLAADKYPGADRVHISHESLKPGQKCPECGKGVIRDTNRPAVMLHFCAQPLIKAMAFVVEKLRCTLCGKLFSATPPPEAGQEKYGQNVAPMLAVMRYGYGMPMSRMADMQNAFGVPLPTGTQWGLVDEVYTEIGPPLCEELTRQAAEGDVLHNDDTTARILAVEKEIRERVEKATKRDEIRTGVFTTGIVSIKDERKIALFCTGNKHAGENLQKVLDHRPSEMKAPIQMCDGLSRNEPESTTIKSNCTIHARREFVDIVDNFPEECEYVLDAIKQLYKHEAHAVEMKMSPEQRLLYHQENSTKLMEGLRTWMRQKIEDKLVEPNSGLGSAFNYVLKRWENLTLFLRSPGAPLDNNICERILKTSIRHRDNSLYYKTMKGAKVGDFFMSIIQTCRLNGKNPFHYITTVRRFAKKCCANPSDWMPWNYQATATAAGPP